MEIKKINVFSTTFELSKNGKFRFRLVRNRMEWRSGARQAVMSKGERRSKKNLEPKK